jgi:hypothetical protein
MAEIILEFDEQGEIKMEGVGFSGSTCLKEMQFLKDALGTETKLTKKPEFFKTEVNHARRTHC